MLSIKFDTQFCCVQVPKAINESLSRFQYFTASAHRLDTYFVGQYTIRLLSSLSLELARFD